MTFVLLLHAHLPDCRRPDHPASLEEAWFFEALAECHLPLIAALDRLVADRVPVRITLSLSPTLLGMLRDRELLARARARFAATEALARRDAARLEWSAREVALWHADFFARARRDLDERCGGDPAAVYAEFSRAGVLEPATTAATHAFLPAHQDEPAIARAQLGVGLDAFAAVFGKRPEFVWLPECGFHPGLDEVLAGLGVRAFAVESHAITQALPAPPRGVRTPVRCPSGVAALGRDPGLSRLVWSAREGYPGHADYREFHHDRIHELPEAEVAAWLEGPAHRLPSGLKYRRVDRGDAPKRLYDPERAAAQAREHARDFVGRLRGDATGGIRFVPFDAELFGHWWFEGPLWIEALFRELATCGGVAASTVSGAIARAGTLPEAMPAASTWGRDGDNAFWVGPETAWLYPQLARAWDRLRRSIRDRPGEVRALRQAARTLLLAQASDWPFLISAGAAAEAGEGRLRDLLGRLDGLLDGLERGDLDPGELARCEALDPAFPDLDLAWFAAREP